MPLKFEIKLELKLKEKTQSQIVTPDLLHGFFFNLLPPNLAEEFHKPSRFKPFSLWSRDIFNFNKALSDHNKENSTPSKEITITISFIKDEYYPAFLAALFERKKKLFLGPYAVKLKMLDGKLIKNDQYQGFDEFLNISPHPYLYFYFKTPVVFKRGEMDYPLPEPRLVFKSLLNKWNYFSPFKVKVDLRKTLEEKICIIFAGIRTHKITLSLGSGITGFTGKAVFYGRNLTDEELLWLNILGEFSNYAGVGRKTTMSFGMTKFEAHNKEEEL